MDQLEARKLQMRGKQRCVSLAMTLGRIWQGA